MPGDALEEIRRLYFKTTRATIDHDFDRAVDLLKAMPESERPRATVFMQGLAEMRKEFKKARRKDERNYASLGPFLRNLRAARRTASGTFRSVVSIFKSFSFSRCTRCMEMPGGVFGFLVNPATTP